MRLKVPELVGREKESKAIEELFLSLVKNGGDSSKTTYAERKICLVHGDPGTGKTALVMKAAAKAQEKMGPDKTLHVVMGKFNQLKTNISSTTTTRRASMAQQQQHYEAPYSKIVDAFEELAAQAPAALIRTCLVNEARILAKLIPAFAKILADEEPGKDEEPEDADADITLGSERLIVAFCAFLQGFCRPENPIVLFMDDLQWSDENSCKLLSVMANDMNIQNFMLVGTYRDEGANDFDLNLDQSLCHVLDVAVGPLDISGVDSMIGRIIEQKSEQEVSCAEAADDDGSMSAISSSSTSTLGSLIHQKTLGNPFFIVQFMEDLHSRKLLKFNYATVKWEWDLDQILAQTNVSDNVVDVLRGRIERMSTGVQKVLVLAACLGFTVQVDILEWLCSAETVMNTLSILDHVDSSKEEEEEKSPSDSPTGEASDPKTFCVADLEDALEEAEENGLVNVSDGVCRFAHDKVQECAYKLFPDGVELDALHTNIGMEIWTRYNEQQPQSPTYAFLAADQINRGASDVGNDTERRMFLIEMNYKVALLAKSTIDSATISIFSKQAIEHVVDPSFWSTSYSLLIQLYGLGAEVEVARGDLALCEEYVKVVFQNATSDEDTFKVRFIRAITMGIKKEFLQACEQCRDLLKLLGIDLPAPTMTNFHGEFSKTKAMLAKISEEDLLSLKPIATDKMVLVMKILKMGFFFGWNGSAIFGDICSLRLLQLTLEHGYSDQMPLALSCYGYILANLGEEQDAFRYSQLAVQSSRSSIVLADVAIMVHGFVQHFEQPAVNSLQPLLEAYRSGLENADMMCGSICVCVYAMVYLFTGTSLNSFTADLGQFCGQLAVCHQYLPLAYILPIQRFALNMTRQTNDPLDVSRDSMKGMTGFVDIMFTEDSVDTTTMLYMQVLNYFIMREVTKAGETLEVLAPMQMKRYPGTQILNSFYSALDGLVALGLYRKTRKKKYRAIYLASIKELAALCKRRSLNVLGMLNLLEAEKASLSIKSSDGKFGCKIRFLSKGTHSPAVVKEKYDRAICQLTRSGVLHLAALANELAGEHMLRMKDEYWSEHYFKQAIRCYTDWGASAKVDQISKAHSLKVDDQQSTSGAIRSGSQFDHSRDTFDTTVGPKTKAWAGGSTSIHELSEHNDPTS